MDTQTPSGPSGFGRLGRSLSLERKLPLLMTGVLAVVLAVSLALTYGTLAQSAEEAAETRLSRAARQLASSIESGIGQRATLQRRVASDSAVQRLLRDAERGTTTGSDGTPNAISNASALPAARAALARLTTATDSGLPIELWSADGVPLVRVGGDSLVASRKQELPEVPPPATGDSAAMVRGDSVRIGAFYVSGGRVYFGISTPIYDGPRRIGYLAQQHRIAADAGAEQRLRNLIGVDVTARYRNHNGTLWSTLGGVPDTAAERRDRSPSDTVFRVYRPNVGELFATEAAIGGSPWVIALELPSQAVFARSRATMLHLGLLSLLLVVVSAVASWVISRRITRPLATLSSAAEALGRGDFSQPVDDSGGDEVARLAKTFNAMRDELGASRMELEAQVEEAQSVTEELEQANELLIEAKDAAELANRAKSDFLAVMSHELRTPLNAIGGYVQLLELEVHGPVSAAQREALGRVARSQQRLLTLITDVLSFAKLDAGRVDYNWTDFSVDAALSALEPVVAPQIRAKRLTYLHEPSTGPVTVCADPDRLQQIVLNLLSNAIKFTPDGGTIRISTEMTDDAVSIHVRDTGAGIPPDRLHTVFEPFVQVDRSLNRPHDGIGLGLSIARDLARGMGGELTVESEVDRGSVFTVKLSRVRHVGRDDGVAGWTLPTDERTTSTASDGR